ncbi:MAG: hypothetical protein JXR73_20765 [Candidatus Omnitrophica bacterium]|nr:hypothetical protein [Candidatus Omnitrophota bacterium]
MRIGTSWIDSGFFYTASVARFSAWRKPVSSQAEASVFKSKSLERLLPARRGAGKKSL